MTWGREREDRDAILAPAIEAAGGVSVIGRALGITKVAVWRWRRVPEKHLRAFAKLSGFTQKQLRPDLVVRRRRKAAGKSVG